MSSQPMPARGDLTLELQEGDGGARSLSRDHDAIVRFGSAQQYRCDPSVLQYAKAELRQQQRSSSQQSWEKMNAAVVRSTERHNDALVRVLAQERDNTDKRLSMAERRWYREAVVATTPRSPRSEAFLEKSKQRRAAVDARNREHKVEQAKLRLQKSELLEWESHVRQQAKELEQAQRQLTRIEAARLADERRFVKEQSQKELDERERRVTHELYRAELRSRLLSDRESAKVRFRRFKDTVRHDTERSKSLQHENAQLRGAEHAVYVRNAEDSKVLREQYQKDARRHAVQRRSVSSRSVSAALRPPSSSVTPGGAPPAPIEPGSYDRLMGSGRQSVLSSLGSVVRSRSADPPAVVCGVAEMGSAELTRRLLDLRVCNTPIGRSMSPRRPHHRRPHSTDGNDDDRGSRSPSSGSVVPPPTFTESMRRHYVPWR